MIGAKTFGRLLWPVTLIATLVSAAPSWAAVEPTYQPTNEAAEKYTFENAAGWFAFGVHSCTPGTPAEVQVMPDIFKMTWTGHFTLVEFRDLGNITVDNTRYATRYLTSTPPDTVELKFSGHIFQDGKQYQNYTTGPCTGLQDGWQTELGDTLLRLKLEYDREHGPEALAAFDKQVQQYQNANPKPELPEDAHKFRVQAEAAVAAKQFEIAAAKYKAAIAVAPWWAEAHFNRGLVLAELQNFDSAILEMKRYLLLNPNAPDARKAQDLIYVWEDHPYVVK